MALCGATRALTTHTSSRSYILIPLCLLGSRLQRRNRFSLASFLASDRLLPRRTPRAVTNQLPSLEHFEAS